MILLDRIARSFGSRTLFRDLTWQIHPGRRIGLVGPNGAGKTTLFRTIAGLHEPDEGRIVKGDEISIGHLQQDVGNIGELPVLDFVLQGRPDLVAAEHRIEELAASIELAETDAELERISSALADTQESYRAAGGYEFRARALEVMRGMGFTGERLTKLASQLSGGWKVRLVLAKLLLQRPSLLLMDEPTNHLDLPSVEWLETFLQSYDGTVIIISHDRYFLNRLVSEIAHLDVDGFHVYPGTYDDFERQRAERLDLLERQKAQQDRQIKEAEKLIDRFRAKASKANMVQSRIKQLDKLERIELPGERKKMVRFRFAEAPRSGRNVVRFERVRKAYGDLVIYRELSLDIERGEKLAIVGPNGAGKTTLLRLVNGALPAESGKIELGHNVICAWFGQHQVEELDTTKTVLQIMESAATNDTVPMIRSVLGAFLFSGDDVGRKVSVLSGGEKSRLALARLLLRPSNVLLLDEPTNHLDMDSREVLQKALEVYDGTVLFVSHDRHFINAVAKRVLHVEDEKIREYPGDYEYYKFKRAEEAAIIAGATSTSSGGANSASGGDSAAEGGSRDDRRERKRREADLRNELSRATKDLRKELESAEQRIATLEALLAANETRMADPSFYQGDSAEVVRLNREQAASRSELEGLYFRWADFSEKIETREAAIRARLG